jgi:ribonuclease BN (tRNA processing enzyme)
MKLPRRTLLAGLTSLPAAQALSTRLALPSEPKSRLVLLGTGGGPTPKMNRAASANAIVVGDRVYMIDAGNGAARQLVMVGLKLDQLASVFVTHHHSDHNIDLGAVLLLSWANNLAHPIEFHGPPPLKQILRDTLAANREDIRVRMADEGRVDPAKLVRAFEHTRPGLVFADDRVRVTSTQVVHPPFKHAFGYRFDCPDRSVVFSGDTAPSDALIALAQGADVLVHEVMYLPAMEKLIASEPNAPRLREHLLASHTTCEGVGRVATAAGVKKLVLSHFVPGGYPYVSNAEWLAAVRPYFAGEIVVGHDLMIL